LEEQPEDLADIRRTVEAEVRKIPDVFPVAVHFNIEGDRWLALAEVVGPRPVSPTELSLVQEAVSKSTSHPVELSIWHRADIVVTAEGYESYKDFTQQTLEERIEKLPEVFEDVAAK
jgi:pyrroloquinoline quinone (PQQ) biosynthesis protein C